VEYYLAMEKNEVLMTHYNMENLGSVILSEGSQSQKSHIV
jgi:hypothetical protein